MRAGKLRAMLILLRSVYLTLHITVTTVLDVYRQRYRREVGDARLRWWSGRLLGLPPERTPRAANDHPPLKQ